MTSSLEWRLGFRQTLARDQDPALSVGGCTDISRQAVYPSSVVYVDSEFRAMNNTYGCATSTHAINAPSVGAYTDVEIESKDARGISPTTSSSPLNVNCASGIAQDFYL
ncbi:MAG: hypothetical protein OSA11_07510 [Candidatus Nanopelagicales bacterium]|nr:hypothetical protein [Candidatus Nanopelagicales bacterium]